MKRAVRHKRKRKGAGKGQAFERLVCRQLSLWVSGGKQDDLFWRSAISGGRATVRAAKGIATHVGGDICSTHPDGHKLTNRYFIECKHRKSLDLHAFMFGKGRLFLYWLVARRQAIQHRRIPLLIAKQNNTPTLVVTPLFGLSWEFGEPITTVSVRGKEHVVVSIYYLEDILKEKFS